MLNIRREGRNALTWLDSFGDHAGRTVRAERDICTQVCRVRLYCLSLWETETTKFLVVRLTPRPLNKQKKSILILTLYFIMLINIISPLTQAAIFVFGVYLEKFIRKRVFTRSKSKRVKQTMRISTCAIVTGLILLYNYDQRCAPANLNYLQCFYLSFDPMQVFHALIANSILFAVHIYEKFIKRKTNFSLYSLKSIIIAPLLEELLFRASFFRIGGGETSVFILAAIFALCHLHKPIRKELKGKYPNWNSSFSQVVFTYIFGLYSFYFLYSFGSVVPSIFLHCYCNFLGPPAIRKDNLYLHVACIIGMLSYCRYFI